MLHTKITEVIDTQGVVKFTRVGDGGKTRQSNLLGEDIASRLRLDESMGGGQ